VAGEVALPGLNRRRSLVIRKLTDDTLVGLLRDSPIGGSEGRDMFESPDDLAALFPSLHDHAGPVGSCLGPASSIHRKPC
jgi:hypothetical protein